MPTFRTFLTAFSSILFTLIFSNCAYAATLAEGKIKSEAKIKIMVLGVYHFDNPGLDVNKSSSFDHLSKKAQKEIAEVNRRLFDFNPDKVFIEQYVTRQPVMSERYQQFIKGEFDISKKANEIYQLGFKVAAQLKHKDVYTIDAPGVFPYEALQAGIKQYNLTNVTKALDEESAAHKESDKTDASRTVMERLVNINQPEQIMANHLFYIDIATQVIAPTPTHKLKAKLETTEGVEHIMVPLDPDYIGAELAAEWYKRNIKIYANIYERVERSKDSAVLLIIGAGHVRILKHLFEDSPRFELVDTNSVLTAVGVKDH